MRYVLRFSCMIRRFDAGLFGDLLRLALCGVRAYAVSFGSMYVVPWHVNVGVGDYLFHASRRKQGLPWISMQSTLVRMQ